ncbi:MAG: hypothetical protein MUF30_11915 [Burkholderiales bacterium]|nr:hypothetical protein [Burkholderiales bacterium]
MIFGAHRLRHPALADAIQRRPGVFAAVLCLLWLLPGLLGRDPWKPDEAHVVGLVGDLFRSGDWIVPTLAGDAYLRYPPLYLGLAALFGQVLGDLLPLHEAFRLVNLPVVGGALLATAAAARALNGPGRGGIAALLVVGSVGALQPAHQLVPDNMLLLATALACLGLARLDVAKTAESIATLAAAIAVAGAGRSPEAGLVIAAAQGLFVATAPTRAGAVRVAIAIGLGALLVAVWPLALWWRAPALATQWLALHDPSRHFAGAGARGAPAPWWYQARVLPWFMWPIWPLALWSLRTARAQWRMPALRLPLAVGVVWLVWLVIARDKRELHALPLLVPAALLAVPGMPQLRRGALNAFFWFAIAFFLFLVAVAWVYGSAAEFGVPERLARHLLRMEPGHVAQRSLALVAVAVVATAGWLVLLFNVRRTHDRPFVVWAGGLVAFWAVATTLFGGYLDHAKSYRPVGAALRAAVTDAGCVTSRGLGDSERALFDYFADLRTHRVEHGARVGDCPWLLVQGTVRSGFEGPPWLLVWEGARAGDKRERFRLYRRQRAEGIANP